MSGRQVDAFDRALRVGQFLAVVVGLCLVFVAVGRRDAELSNAVAGISELKSITSKQAEIVNSLTNGFGASRVEIDGIHRDILILQTRLDRIGTVAGKGLS